MLENTIKTLGIIIPYYRNTFESEKAFQELMQEINKQLTGDMILFVFEDGQLSPWLQEYNKENIIITGSSINQGVGFARNQGLNYLIDKVNYILFIDSDDMISSDYLKRIYNLAKKSEFEIIESTFYVNKAKVRFSKNVIRTGVAGSCLKSSIIGNIHFRESFQIGEDTRFMKDVIDLNIHKKVHALCTYYYRRGINPNSLTMRYQRKEIGEKRSW